MDIQSALKDGYTKEEIADELGRRTGMNYRQAIKDGHSIDDVLSELNRRDAGGVAKRPPKTLNVKYDTPEWAGKYPNLYGVTGALKEVSRFGAETAAMIGGGLTGGAVAGPGGAVAGAGLAYGGVKALERFLEGEKATIPEAAKISIKDVGTGATMEMTGQSLGRVVGGALEKISHPGKSLVPKEQVLERISKAREYGIELSPAEATGSKGLALYESMLDKSPFSTTIINNWREIKQLRPLLAQRERLLASGKASDKEVGEIGEQIQDNINRFLAQYKNLNEGQVNALRDNILKKMGTNETYDGIGKTVQETISGRSKAYYEKAQELYNYVGSTIPKGSVVNIKNTRTLASTMLETELKKPASLQNKEVVSLLKDLSGKNASAMQDIQAYPKQVQEQIMAKLEKEGMGSYDWETVQAMRSSLNQKIAESDAAMKTAYSGTKFQASPVSGVYKRLRQSLDSDISNFSNEIGGETKEAFDIANMFYKEGKQVYSNPKLRQIMSANPERVVDMIFRPKGGSEIDLVIKATSKDFFDKTMKPSITKKLLEGDSLNIDRTIKKYGDEILQKVYSPDEIKNLKSIAKDSRLIMEDKLPGGSFLATISKERPEVIVDSILGSPEKLLPSKSLIRNIHIIRGSVDKKTFDLLQGQLAERIFQESLTTGFVGPMKLSRIIETREGALRAIYTPEQVNWLKEISEIGKRMSAAESMAANPSGTAQNVITWGTWGTILRGVREEGITGLGKAIIDTVIAPQWMAKIYLSDAGRKYFALGLKTPIGTKKGVEIAAKLTQIAAKNNIDTGNNQIEPPLDE